MAARATGYAGTAAGGPSLAVLLGRPNQRVVLDLGCGDARATARLAARQPGWLVIGADANLDAATRVLRRARRSAEKGGLPNLFLLLAPADRLPDQLAGRVDELRIDLPWGSLLDGLLAAGPALVGSFSRVLAPGGLVRIVLNPRALPADLTPEQASVSVGRALESAGLSDVRTEITAIAPETGWGKRLASGRPLEVIVVEARRSAA